MRKLKTCVLAGAVAFVLSPQGWAAGTPAGTDIENTAQVSFEVNGTPVSENSNTLRVTVAEVIDINVTLLSPQTPVAPGDASQALLFTVTNTGNGSESFALLIDSNLAGDDFDPVPSLPDSIFFDTDGSGDLSPGDTPYNPGVNDPVLAPDAGVDILIVNDIPAAATDGQIGRSELQAQSITGSGAPGTVFAGLGDGGVDAIVGNSGGAAADAGEYVVTDIDLAPVKSATVVDPFGGNEPVPGAEITYTIVVTPSGSGTAVNAEFTDAIPTNTSYKPGSILFNGVAQSDAPDADAGQLVSSGSPYVSVELGDLTGADGAQTIEFVVVID